ncbi:MAG TPA: nitroreductase family protein [Pseudonocardiaceae bacterium]|nr:nitroreductase family protein [Pseudonocardiaceae bacterium]
MQTWDAITARRNVRAYTDQPIPAAHLDQILEAGRRAPSSKNTQPWDFVVVTDRARLQELATVWQGAGHVAHSVATIALVAPIAETPPQRVEYDLGQATMNIMLAAADLGVGSGHTAVADQDKARALLGFPADRRCAYLIALGYPADRPLAPIRNPSRRPFDEVVHRERW